MRRSRLGGANAIITNQQYHPPGRISSTFYGWLNGGRWNPMRTCHRTGGQFSCPGPADLPPVVRTDWLDLGCTLYRREHCPGRHSIRFSKGIPMVRI